MKHFYYVALFLVHSIAWSQSSNVAIHFSAIETSLSDEDLLLRIDALATPSQNAYIEFLITEGRDNSFPSNSNPSLQQCLQEHEWSRGFDRILYARSGRGVATYRWNKSSQKGSWNILRGTNPLYSDDRSVLLIQINKTPYLMGFYIATRQVAITQQSKEAAIALVRSFTKEKAWIELRPDYFYWLGVCGFPGPQAQDLNISYIPGQVSEVTETCILSAGETDCKWRTAPNRR